MKVVIRDRRREARSCLGHPGHEVSLRSTSPPFGLQVSTTYMLGDQTPLGLTFVKEIGEPFWLLFRLDSGLAM